MSQRRHLDAPHQNMALLLHLRGRIDPARLSTAFAAVVAASDALRTRITEHDGTPRVATDTPIRPSEVIALARPEVQAWAAERASRPVDIATCGYDSVILAHDDGSASWYLGLHHTITDASSHALVVAATARAYNGEELALDSYYDWVRWLGDLDDPRTEKANRHWQSRTPAPGVGRLYEPVGRGEPSATRLELDLDGELRGALTAGLATDYASLTDELAWTTLLTTAAAVYLHRVTRADRFSIGVPVHNRSDPQARDLIGALVELFPVDIEIRSDDTFAALHKRVGRSVMQTLRLAAAGTAPPGDYEAVVNVISRAPIHHFGDVPVTTDWIHSGATEPSHLFRVQLSSFGDGFQLALDMNNAAAAPAHRRLAPGHFSAILRQLVADPTQPIGAACVISDEERAVLDAWGSADDWSDATTSIVAQLQAGLETRHDIALVDGDLTMSGAQLWQWASGAARWLRQQGVEVGDRVGLELGRGAEMVAAIMGALLAGASYVPLDPSQPRARLDRLAARAGCKVVLTHVPGADELASIDRLVHLPEPDDEAYLLFTSGSTGEPKGVPISQLGLARYVRFATQHYADPQRPPVVPLFSALTFDLTVTSVFLPLVAGGRLVVVAAEGPAALAEIAGDRGLTWCKATPSHLEILTRLLPDDHGLRTLVVGGEAFGTKLARQLLERLPELTIFNEYGPTEAVVGCMIHEVAADELAIRPEVPIGRPAPGVSLRVVDGHLHHVPLGSPGELLISHVGLTEGYLDSPSSDADPFVEIERRRWYRSGDLVRLVDPDTLVYLGRIDEQVKVGGIRLEPVEVEEALDTHPAVAQAAVRLWTPTRKSADQHCVRCGLPSNVPGARFDECGVCAICHAYDRIKVTTASYFKSIEDLDAARDGARNKATGSYDCLHLLSGGKDSTYALYQLVEHGWNPYVLTLDNGFISPEALDNVRRSVDDLGLDHEIATSDAMDAIFRDSLERHSNVCNGCYKTIYTLATNRAVELGIPVIVTGLSRGQLFETRLIPQQFSDERFDPAVIDRAVVEARKAYHRLDDAPNRLLDTSVFESDDVFDQITYLDFYRYVDVELAEMFEFLDTRAPWVRPSDTGRSTNCLVNAAGIHTHLTEQGYHNYAEPYAWDVRLGHKTRDEAMAELDDQLDLDEVSSMLATIGYEPTVRELLTAWIVLAPGVAESPSPAEFRAHLADRLPAHAIPAAFVVVNELPLTTNGKLDTARLKAPDRVHRPGPALHVSPESDTERAIVEVWEEVLHLEPIGVEDDFFALGGDSLAALQMVVAVSERLSTLVPEEFAFVHSTPRALAGAIEAESRSAGGALVDDPVARPAGQPPGFSDGELAILFDQANNPDTVRYNVGRLYHVSGMFDVERFTDALRLVAAHHAPLLWTYRSPRQRLDPEQAVFVDVNSDRVDDATMLDRARKAHRVPFDLEQGPLLRCWIQPLEDESTAVLLGVHHVAGDAASFDRIWSQVDRVLTGGAPDLAGNDDGALDYFDITQWHRATEDPAAREHWLSIGGDHAADRLAIHRPTQPTDDGFLLRVASFTPEELRRGAGSTGFATALAALAATLRSYSSGGRIGLGIVASNRNHPAADDLVGYFLNTLPVELDCTASATMRELAAAAGPQIGLALAHRTYPFAQMLADRREAGRPEPVTDILLAFDELPRARLAGHDVEHRVLFNGDAVADATFFVEVRDDRVDLSMEYRGSVMAEPDAERLLTHFETMLRAAIFTPDEALVDVAPPGYVPSVLRGPALPEPELVLGPIARHIRDRGDAAAVVCGEEVLSWSQLGQRSDAVAAHLQRAGVRRGDRVIVCLQRTTDLVPAIVGVLRAGAVYVPIDPTYPSDRLGLLADNAGAVAALVGPGQAPLSDHDIPISEATQATAGLAAHPVEVGADETAYVIFTSGSTGVPRGVGVTHGQLAASNAARRVAYGSPSDRFLLVSSLAFDSSVAGFYWTLVDGGTLVVPTDAEAHDPDALLALFARHTITHTLLVPTLYQALLERGGAQESWPSQVVVAGEACAPRVVAAHFSARPTSRLANEYGPTEATVWATVHHCGAHDDLEVPIGAPIAGAGVAVVDESLRPVPEGVEGELVCSGRTVTDGYTNDAVATSTRFGEDPELGGRWFRTGDRAVIRSGTVRFLGRSDNQLNLGGVRAEPEEIEGVLSTAPGVAAAVVVGSDPRSLEELIEIIDDADVRVAMRVAAESSSSPAADLRSQLLELVSADLRLVAHLEPVGTAEIDLAVVRDHVAGRLPPLLRPAIFVLHEELPRTPNGKIDRAEAEALPLPATGGASPQPMAGPDHTAQQLAALFGEVLRHPSVGPDDSFFDLGGHSLLAMQLLLRIEESTGVAITVASFFGSPTPMGLAALIDRLRDGDQQYEFLIPIQPEGSLPPIYGVHVIGTNAEYYTPLAARLGRDQPVFGLVLPDLFTRATPRTLDDIVSSYADDIDRCTPQVPVCLAGVSLGSVVAMEVARELQRRGRQVLLVAMLDASGPAAHLHVPTGRQRVAAHADELRLQPLGYVGRRLKFRALKLQRALERSELLLRENRDRPLPPRLVKRRYIEDNLGFMADYDPEPYAGRVTVFKASEDPFLAQLAEKGMGWAEVVSGTLEVVEIQGDHMSILVEPQVEQLATEVAASIRRAADRSADS